MAKTRGTRELNRKPFYVQLKNRHYELMKSNAQLVRQAILHYVDSVMKRPKV